MSIVQLSRFLSFFSSDSFSILSKLISSVKNFFIFLSRLIRFPFGPLQATACIGYHICKALSRTFFSALPVSLIRFSLPGRSASASPAELIFGGFKSPSSATGAILSPLEVIVNVFSIFYLFQTIHKISCFISIFINTSFPIHNCSFFSLIGRKQGIQLLRLPLCFPYTSSPAASSEHTPQAQAAP